MPQRAKEVNVRYHLILSTTVIPEIPTLLTMTLLLILHGSELYTGVTPYMFEPFKIALSYRCHLLRLLFLLRLFCAETIPPPSPSPSPKRA